MGQVYLARQQTMNRPCALKLLPHALASQPSFVRRFRSEAQLMANLNHPGIVSVHNFDRYGDEFFLEMEYIDGGDLQQKIQAHRKGIPPGEVKELLRQILLAVAYAHSQSVIHRDLKPANILISRSGAIKISDFGLAAIVGESFHNSLIEKTITESQLGSQATIVSQSHDSGQSITGTLAYMSPQTMRCEKPCASDDIYAIGIIAYYMITGRLPSVSYKKPSEVVGGLNRNWDKFIAKAVEEEPRERFLNAEEMLKALEHIDDKRRLAPAVLTAALIMAALAGGLAYFPGYDRVKDLSRRLLAQVVVADDTVQIRIHGNPARMRVQVRDTFGGRVIDTRELACPDVLNLSIRHAPYDLHFSSHAHADASLRFDPGRDAPEITINLAPLVVEKEYRIQTHVPGAEIWMGSGLLGVTPASVRLSFTRTTANALWEPVKLLLRHPSFDEQALQVRYEDADQLNVVYLPPKDAFELSLPGNVSIRFVRIPAGKSIVGSPTAELGRTPDETQREVSLAFPLLMAVTEVTQDQYRAVMGSNPSYHRRDSGNRPVEQILYDDIVGPDSFLARFNALLKAAGLHQLKAALPTEVEWEYACRAGTTTALNSGRDLENSQRDTHLDTLAVYARPETATVASKQPNLWGLHDMHGNVWEWTDDGVLRGGSFFEGAASSRSASRLRGMKTSRERDSRFGFRIVLRQVE